MKDLLLLTAPPAAGKTYWIKSLISELGHTDLLIISPLRALANECTLNWKGRVLVMTPEEWRAKRIYKKVVIFDEFHLHFYWGDTFRPLMWEVFFDLVNEAELSILLTATFSEEMQNEVKHFENHFDRIIWVNHGNQILKNRPSSYLKISPNLMKELIQFESRNGTSLIFCAYREEVMRWGNFLRKLGFRVWTCVGGEASLFSLQVQTEEPPDFIVATTVLSHGVNLPKVSTIYFLYQVKNIDFWIQMVARGGRRGEKFRVYSLENPYGIKWNRWTNDLAILILRFKISYPKFKRQLSQWFLKD